ncbi:hypothetical protein RUM43_008786 [Polyplax serrata]|uniref:UV radiation resistance-associated gene protein n=1 Tax=Polyplax serrata TaxID=468196 RepID=A0AAN8PVG3_POLSC
MFLTQHFVPRWKKEWLPLSSQQLRLRNLIRILAFGIENDKKEKLGTKSNTNNGVDGESQSVGESYYFTLHATTMSAPFYTSEKLKGGSLKWKELEMSCWEGTVPNSVDAVVIRLWFSNPLEGEDKVLAVWGVYLSGLMYLGPSLRVDIPLKPSSIVFLMPGGYFTDPKCLASDMKLRYSCVTVKKCDVRPSYSISSLKRLQTLQHVIKKEVADAEMLKKKISMGDFFMNESRGRTTLRKLLNKHKPKTNHIDLMRVKENIEITKYRVNILKEEKNIMLSRLNDLDKQIKSLSKSNQSQESKIIENNKLLKLEIFNHREWKRSYIDRREKYLHSKAMLNLRKKHLISELNLIYPIAETSSDKFTICGVHLPNSEDFAGHDDLQISIALGFVTHIIQMISVFLQIPLRYPVVHYGSRSRILDPITDKMPDSEREFCLFIKGKEKLQFHYAVYLLNKNIAQMRWLCGLPTSDLRNTLENLASLVKMKFGSTNLDQGSRSLSSSTADICGSNVSVSSPLSSVKSFQSKKFLRTHYMSESRTDLLGRGMTSSSIHVPGHRISKSMGSSKDFPGSLFAAKNRHLLSGSGKSVNKNLSCSLDKGLNEYEDTINCTKSDADQFGSDPMLSCSITKGVHSEGRPTTRKTDSPKVPFLDDDVEVPVMVGSAQSGQNQCSSLNLPRENCKECGASFTDDKSDTDSAVEVVVSDFEKQVESAESSSENKNTKKSETNPSCTMSGAGEEIPVTGNKCDTEKSLRTGDSLLDSVTNRTEALVHQTTSFNRVRTRFKSTLESSN